MYKYIHLAFVPAVLLLVVSQFVSLAYAQTVTSSQPTVQTYSTATSSTIIITSPSGYKNEVVSTYDGNQFHTFATSTPLTAEDIANMQYNILSEEQTMQQLFQAQQALFNQQEQIFQGFWGER